MKSYLLILSFLLTLISCNQKMSIVEEKFTPYEPPVSYEQADAKAKEMLKELTLDEKLDLIGGYKSFFIHGIEKFSIPPLYMSDATQGVHIRKSFAGSEYEDPLEKSTAFPCGLALTATWNKHMANEYARSIGEECRAGDIAVLLGPGLNIYRVSQCGRNFEYFGEDPFLAGRMIENYVVGVQSTGTIATLKHFVANNTDYFRRKSNSIIDERTLHEIYMPAFKSGIDAGAMAIMTSYNLVNGEWAGQSEFVINELLRNRLEYKWLVMTDWWSVWDGEKVIKSGQNLEMPGAEALKNTRELLEQGKVSEAEIDEMVLYILRPVLAMQLDERPVKDTSYIAAFEAHKEVALNTARESVVLLENKDNILPLQKERYQSILVTGKYVEKLAVGGGSGYVEGYDKVNMLDALTNEFGEKIKYIGEPTNDEIAAADLVILSVGTYDSEGYDRPFDLPEEEEQTILKTVGSNPNTIVVVNSGSGINMSAWNKKAAAVLYAWYPGQIGNIALAEVLAGKTNPSGKLPMTIEKRFADSPGADYIPQGDTLVNAWRDDLERKKEVYDLPYDEGIFVGYRWYEKKQIEPLYPFGYGKSYTTFEYKKLTVSSKKFAVNDTIEVSITIKNSGTMDGKETVQVYVRDLESSVERPVKELKGFEKVMVKKGESEKVKVQLSKEDFSFWDSETKDWKAEPGKFEILVGPSSQQIEFMKEVELL